MKKRKYYEKSLKTLKKMVKENKNLTEEEWDKFAKENCLFSGITLKAKNNVDTFEELKEKLNK